MAKTAPDVIAQPGVKKDDDEEKPEDTGPDPAEADKRLKSIFRRQKRLLTMAENEGRGSKKFLNAQEKRFGSERDTPRKLCIINQ